MFKYLLHIAWAVSYCSRRRLHPDRDHQSDIHVHPSGVYTTHLLHLDSFMFSFLTDPSSETENIDIKIYWEQEDPGRGFVGAGREEDLSTKVTIYHSPRTNKRGRVIYLSNTSIYRIRHTYGVERRTYGCSHCYPGYDGFGEISVPITRPAPIPRIGGEPKIYSNRKIQPQNRLYQPRNHYRGQEMGHQSSRTP